MLRPLKLFNLKTQTLLQFFICFIVLLLKYALKMYVYISEI